MRGRANPNQSDEPLLDFDCMHTWSGTQGLAVAGCMPHPTPRERGCCWLTAPSTHPPNPPSLPPSARTRPMLQLVASILLSMAVLSTTVIQTGLQVRPAGQGDRDRGGRRGLQTRPDQTIRLQTMSAGIATLNH